MFHTYKKIIYICVRMPNKRSKKEIPRLPITKTTDVLLTPLDNIASNMGITMTEFLKPHLRDIIDSYPEYLKKPPTTKKCKPGTYIYGFSPKLREELYNIADNLGVSHSAIIKIGLIYVKDKYEKRLQEPPPTF